MSTSSSPIKNVLHDVLMEIEQRNIPPNISPDDFAFLLKISREMSNILDALLNNSYVDLVDLLYEIREKEGQGWNGPSVSSWGRALVKAENLLCSPYEVDVDKTSSSSSETLVIPDTNTN